MAEVDALPCRACGAAALRPAGSPAGARLVCAHCGRCWEGGPDGEEVDPQSCPGCPHRGTCEACPTWLCDSLSREHELRDGSSVLVRPLLYGDRFELAAGFDDLSAASRELRFFQAPDELGGELLEHLTNLDYHDHYACAAFLLDEGPWPKGVGVARYLREPDDPTVAEVAVTVLDEHQRRGIGTLLTRTLGEVAAQKGIRTFVNFILWENEQALELLRAEGARVTAAEPGVARVEIDIPVPVDEVEDPLLHRILTTLTSVVTRAPHRDVPAATR